MGRRCLGENDVNSITICANSIHRTFSMPCSPCNDQDCSSANLLDPELNYSLNLCTLHPAPTAVLIPLSATQRIFTPYSSLHDSHGPGWPCGPVLAPVHYSRARKNNDYLHALTRVEAPKTDSSLGHIRGTNRPNYSQWGAEVYRVKLHGRNTHHRPLSTYHVS